jgi:hypothetical protein
MSCETDSAAFFATMALKGRLIKLENVAPIVKFLCTDGAWINDKSCMALCRFPYADLFAGQVLFAHGGMAAR